VAISNTVKERMKIIILMREEQKTVTHTNYFHALTIIPSDRRRFFDGMMMARMMKLSSAD
jgi:hypothetical protein